MRKSLEMYLVKKFGSDWTVYKYEQINAKDHKIELDFGDGEILGVMVRERNGENGNYRISLEWDASED